MKVFVVFAAVACFAQSALSSWIPYHGTYSHGAGYHGPLATPVVTPSGFLADTPEVAAAKAAHLSEVAKSSSHVTTSPAHSYTGTGYNGAGYSGSYAGGYHGPLASPVVTPSGFLADTPEVAAAKAAHLSEVAKSSSHVAIYPVHGYANAGYPGKYAGAYHASIASPVITPSGYLADTPEVAAAKAAHLSLVSGAAHGAYAPAAPVAPWAGAYAAPYAGAYTGAHDDGSYKGEGAYAAHYDAASHYDDGSYKPHLYEHGHY